MYFKGKFPGEEEVDLLGFLQFRFAVSNQNSQFSSLFFYSCSYSLNSWLYFEEQKW